MRHALMYVGGFERNFPNLSASSTSFTGTDGKEHAYQPWPKSADGLRLSYMGFPCREPSKVACRRKSEASEPHPASAERKYPERWIPIPIISFTLES